MNPKGYVSEEVKELRKIDLIKLISTNSYQEISFMYNVSHTTVRNELIRQIDEKQSLKFNYTVEEIESMNTIKEDSCVGGFGQWMESDIRKFGKQITNEKNRTN